MPIVPCPAMVRGSSNGCTYTAPVRSLSSWAAALASSYELPTMTGVIQSPPIAAIRSRFWRGVLPGRKTRPLICSLRQAKARPWPWFPALAHTTPRARSAVSSEDIRL